MNTGMSMARGATDTPLLDITVGEALRATAMRQGGQMALISRHQMIRWTWAQFDAEVDRIALGLLARGVRKGDRVAIWSPNCAEWIVLQFATARIGAILVNINPAYRVAEVEYALNKVGCCVLVTAAHFKSSDYVTMLTEIWPRRVPSLRLIVLLGDRRHDMMLPWCDLGVAPGQAPGPAAHDATLAGVAATLSPHDPINIQFTSGTTGFPKGAMLTHHNIVNNGYFSGAMMRLTNQDRICIPVPLYHCFGMVLGNLAAVTHGATIIYPGDSFDPSLVLRAVSDEGCTALHGVPTMFITILNHPELDHFDLSTLRTGIMAGSPCPLVTMRQVMDQLGMQEVTIGYGMTETSPVTTQTAVDDPIEDRVGSVGRVHPHAEARIVGPDGATLPYGVQGEYCTRGYAVMRGYWDDPEKTAEAIDAEGWMHSGDLAVMDERGYVRITGRIKDMIIRGGENIYPREIEEFLLTHPDIADVQVFGVADMTYGEEVCAWIIPRPGMELTVDDVLGHCRGRIAHYKVPRHIRVVGTFVMTVTGKAQKFEMRRLMEAELSAI